MWNGRDVIGMKNDPGLWKISLKTANFDVYKRHVAAYVNNFDTLWKEKLRPRWARQKFRLYCGKRRALQEFVNSLRGDEIPLIAYGAATFGSGGRGERSVPVKGIQRLVRQTYPTVLVDEYKRWLGFGGARRHERSWTGEPGTLEC